MKNAAAKKRLGAPKKNDGAKVSKAHAKLTLTQEQNELAEKIATQMDMEKATLIRRVFLQWMNLRERNIDAANRFFTNDDFTVS